jgi:RND family efflux transporter MFP subunit
MNIKQLMKTVWKPVSGLVGLAVLVIWSAGMLETKVEPGHLAPEAGFPVPADVTPVVVKLVPTAARVEVVGTVASEQRINLSSRLSATIQEVLVSAGDAVTNGQLLVALDDRELREQLSGAEAQFKQAEAEYARATQLFEKAAMTEQARLAAESGYQGAKARLEQVRVMLGYTKIVSPIDGVVADRKIEAGDLSAPGQVLLSVYDPRRMRLEVPVPVRLVSKFTLNQKVELRLEGAKGLVEGVVQEIVSEVDSMTRTRKLKVKIGDASLKLLPGGYGSLWVEGDMRPALWVPVSAVYGVGQLEYVQVVAGGRAIRRAVKTGVLNGDKVEILSGLDDGDKVLPVPVMKEG